MQSYRLGVHLCICADPRDGEDSVAILQSRLFITLHPLLGQYHAISYTQIFMSKCTRKSICGKMSYDTTRVENMFGQKPLPLSPYRRNKRIYVLLLYMHIAHSSYIKNMLIKYIFVDMFVWLDCIVNFIGFV